VRLFASSRIRGPDCRRATGAAFEKFHRGARDATPARWAAICKAHQFARGGTSPMQPGARALVRWPDRGACAVTGICCADHRDDAGIRDMLRVFSSHSTTGGQAETAAPRNYRGAQPSAGSVVVIWPADRDGLSVFEISAASRMPYSYWSARNGDGQDAALDAGAD